MADSNGTPDPERKVRTVFLQHSLLPKPPTQAAQIQPEDEMLAGELIRHLGDFEWTATQLNHIQQTAYDQTAYLITSDPGPQAQAYTLLALFTLDVERTQIDPETDEKARALQQLRSHMADRDMYLDRMSLDEIGDLVGRMAESAQMDMIYPHEAVEQLLDTLAQMFANARQQEVFMNKWLAAFHGSAMIDLEELGALWDTATSESARAHIADEYGFQDVEHCARILSGYRMAMLQLRQRIDPPPDRQ
jgi:hypothetical protein